MASFEDALTHHRDELFRYLADWSQQQESLMAQYVEGQLRIQRAEEAPLREHTRPDGVETLGSRPRKTQPRQEPTCVTHEEPDENLGQTRAHSSISHGAGSKTDAGSERQVDGIMTVGSSKQIKASTERESKATRASHSCARRSALALATEGIEAGISFMAGRRGPIGKMRHTRSDVCTRVVESSAFTWIFAIIILANVACMAIAADHILDSVKNGVEQNDSLFRLADALFTVCYVIELTLKMFAYRTDFFVGPECHWHVFDLVLVLSAILDLVAPIFLGSAVNVVYLRITRIVRLIKMARVVKVYRSFKELRVIVASLIGCMRTMFWAIALIVVVLFTFSLFFVQGVTDYLLEHPPSESNEDLMDYWGSMITAMISLFQSSTGGADWSDVAGPLSQLGWAYYCAFMTYICFFMFVVVNVLTGLFVDAALNASVKDDAMLIREEMKNKQQYVEQIHSLFRRLDDNESGNLTWEEFQKGMHSADMNAFASAMGIEISDIQEFFRLISADGRDVVDIDRFVVGCMKLKGSAKSLDVVSLLHRARILEHQTHEVIRRSDQRLEEQQALFSERLEEHRALLKHFLQQHEGQESMLRCGSATACAPSESMVTI